MKVVTVALAVMLWGGGSAAFADETELTLYLGSGPGVSVVDRDETPYVLGFLRKTESGFLFGADIANEGEKIEKSDCSSTRFTSCSTSSIGRSYNGLIGYEFSVGEQTFIGLGAVVGALDEGNCADAFLPGVGCPADLDEDKYWVFNGGGFLSLRFNVFSFGVRLTDNSSQAIFGVSF